VQTLVRGEWRQSRCARTVCALNALALHLLPYCQERYEKEKAGK
jgi:hypothetical protein